VAGIRQPSGESSSQRNQRLALWINIAPARRQHGIELIFKKLDAPSNSRLRPRVSPHEMSLPSGDPPLGLLEKPRLKTAGKALVWCWAQCSRVASEPLAAQVSVVIVLSSAPCQSASLCRVLLVTHE
jgi:hypothetical protein